MPPLFISIARQQTRTARALITAGAHISLRDRHGLTPLLLAARSGCLGAVEALMEQHADINDRNPINGFHALHYAVGNMHFSIARLLVLQGADINAATDQGLTALHQTACLGCLDFAMYLLSNGAVLDPLDCAGQTPHDYALRNGKADLAALLQAHSDGLRCHQQGAGQNQ